MTCRGVRANGTLVRRLLSVTATGWQPTSQRNCRAFWNCQRQEIWYTFSIRNTLLRQKGCFMAQKVQVLLVDDLDGSEATETVTFGLDGASYEIDLSSGNAGKLRKELAHYVEHCARGPGQYAPGGAWPASSLCAHARHSGPALYGACPRCRNSDRSHTRRHRDQTLRSRWPRSRRDHRRGAPAPSVPWKQPF